MTLNYAIRLGFVLYLSHKSGMTLSYALRLGKYHKVPKPWKRRKIKRSNPACLSLTSRCDHKVVELGAPIRLQLSYLPRPRSCQTKHTDPGLHIDVQDDNNLLLQEPYVRNVVTLRVQTRLAFPPAVQRMEIVLKLSHTCQKIGMSVN